MPSRRRFLATTATGAAVGLAGCSSVTSLFGGSAGYRQWLASPDTIEADDYTFISMTPKAILEREDEMDDALQTDREVPLHGLDDPDVLDRYTSYNRWATAATGDIPRDDVVEALEDDDYEAGDDLAGLQYYAPPEDSFAARHYAVGEDVLVATGGEDGEARDRIEGVLDAREGQAERYPAADEDVAALVDVLQDGDVVALSARQQLEIVEGVTATGYVADLTDESATVVGGFVFDEGEADVDAVEDWDGLDRWFYGADVEVTRSGRAVRAEATVDLDEVTGFGISNFLLDLPDDAFGGEPDAPQVSFSFDYVGSDGSGTLTITHDGGDNVAGDQLILVRNGERIGSWTDNGGSADDGTVAAGNTVTIDATDDATVRLVWESPDGDTSATLAEWQGPGS